MSAALVLPFVWAFANERAAPQAGPAPECKPPGPPGQKAPEPQMAFYRKYTEAMLRRYVRMSMEAGKVPSLLGREMFRAKVTSYRVESFEDVVIADLSVLKTQMKELVGNGQPGRLTRIEGRMSDHEQAMQRLKGAAAALGGLLTLAHFAIDILFHRR